MEDTIIVQTKPASLPQPDNVLSGEVMPPYTPPSVVTSERARKKLMKDYAELSRLTGIQYTF